MTRAAEKRARYRNDAGFRESQKTYNREYQRAHRKDPLWRKLSNLRKLIWQDRESLAKRQRHCEKVFKRLESRIKQEARVRAEWKQKLGREVAK